MTDNNDRMSFHDIGNDGNNGNLTKDFILKLTKTISNKGNFRNIDQYLTNRRKECLTYNCKHGSQ